jgi:glyoxylase-like metal-dependent hydrolase (beta-lactamase superfamily II)
MCTHLHVDHCGWNTRLLDGRWVPTVPNAKYVFSKTEYEHRRGLAGQESVNTSVCQDSVLPVIESGQAEVVDGEGVVGDRLNPHESDVRGIEARSIRLRLENRHQTKRGVR